MLCHHNCSTLHLLNPYHLLEEYKVIYNYFCVLDESKGST